MNAPARAAALFGAGSLPKVAWGKGSYVHDTAGKRYIDGSSGPAAYCLGHGNEEVNAAIARQLDKIAHGYRYTFTSDPLEELTEIVRKWVMSGCEDGTARLWDLKPIPRLPRFDYGGWIGAVAFSPDGRFVLTGGERGTARLWDAATGEHLRDLVGHTGFINYGAAFSADGKYIITASEDTTVRLWNAQSGEEVQRIKHTDTVSDVKFSPDGMYILTAGDEGVRLSDAETGQEIRQFGELEFAKAVRVQRAAFSPDGKYVLTAAPWPIDGKARLWDVATGALIREYQTSMISMESVAFSPDGKTMLAAGLGAQLWEVETGKEIRQFVGHTDYIFTAAFSPDGKYIATASADNTARLWDVQTGQELRRFVGHTAGVENVAFSPDGKFLITGSDDGTARLWDVDYHTTMKYLCSRLLRDFTEEERAQYGIKDHTPTCPPKP